jgi:hypothetical protein
MGLLPVALHVLHRSAQGLADQIEVLLDMLGVQALAQPPEDSQRLLEALARGPQLARRRMELPIDVERLRLSVGIGHRAGQRDGLIEARPWPPPSAPDALSAWAVSAAHPAQAGPLAYVRPENRQRTVEMTTYLEQRRRDCPGDIQI